MKSSKKRKRYVLLAVAVIAGLLAWEFDSNLILTMSPSLKYHVYFKNNHLDRLKKGDYVMFKLHNDKYAKEDDKILKEVVCTEGDMLTVTDDKRYFCNGEFITRAKDYTRAGDKLNHFVFNGIIDKGDYFVIGHHKDSYDSKYFGFIVRDQMLVRAQPFFAERRKFAKAPSNEESEG